MTGFDRLLNELIILQGHFRHFLAGLEPRTVTLLDLLVEPERAARRLGANWIDGEVLRRRLETAANFLGSISLSERVRGWTNLPLLFFQPVDWPAEVRFFRELQRGSRMDRIIYKDCRRQPLSIRFLHVQANFGSVINGISSQPTGRIPARLHYSSIWNSKNWDARRIIGFQLPNIPQLLKLSPYVTTEYLARMIIHDVGHVFLPQISRRYECLHNVGMLVAAGGWQQPDQPLSSLFEEIMLREATDPLFSFTAEKYLDRCRKTKRLSWRQRAILRVYRRWYASRIAKRHQRAYWQIRPSMARNRQNQRLTRRMRELIASDFAGYQTTD